MKTVSIDDWVAEVKAMPGSDGIGMILVHEGMVRGRSRSGDPVRGMKLAADRDRLKEVGAEAGRWPGIFVARAWVNEGSLSVGDDIMKVLVAGDIRENVFAALELLVSLVKREVVSETELRCRRDAPLYRSEPSLTRPRRSATVLRACVRQSMPKGGSAPATACASGELSSSSRVGTRPAALIFFHSRASIGAATASPMRLSMPPTAIT